MLSTRTTKALPVIVRRLQSSRSPVLISGRFYESPRFTGSFSTLASSPYIPNWKNEERKKEIALPRISLQHPLMLHNRSFSSAATDKKDATFRERMEDRKEQGLLAMANARELAKRYGPVFVGTYFAIYFGTIGLLFAGIESGALDPVYVLSLVTENANEAKSTVQIITDFMEDYSLTRPWAPIVERNPEIANLAVAWIATKFTEPIRLVLSAAVVPKVARTLGYSKKDESEETEEESSTESNKETTTESTEKATQSAEGEKKNV